MTAADTKAAFESGMRALHGKPRGDEHFIHVADVKGCNVATRARVLRKPMLPFTIQKLVQFQMGHDCESLMAQALSESLGNDGWQIMRDVLMAFQFADEDGDDRAWVLAREFYPKRLVGVTADGMGIQPLDPAKTIIGHADVVAWRELDAVVLEAKSGSRAFTKDVRWDHATQAQMYSLMYRALRQHDIGGTTVVGMIDRRQGDYGFYDVPNPLTQYDMLRHLALNALACYHSDPPDDVDPPQPWLCKTCDYGDCARNVNPERLSLQGVF